MGKELWADGEGRVHYREAPARAGRPGWVLVATSFSGVSIGTERAMVAAGFRGRLGYQASGIVTEVADGGPKELLDRPVAVYGAPYTGHGEDLWVPAALVAELPSEALLPAGAFAGLGAISLHALRLGTLQIGESVLVVGLGMVGQWCVRLAAAAGLRVMAVDPQPQRRDLALAGGAEGAVGDLSDPAVAAAFRVRPDTGYDAVLLTAHSTDPGLANRCLEHVADKGRFVVAGDLPLHIDRELLFARENRLVVSRAAGPGRYDAAYEADGHDYPAAYVRWTEGRNLAAVVALLASGRVRVSELLGEAMDPEAALSVYDERAVPARPGALLAWDGAR
jgi:threonine dehydrogenase-like Zn-dependent dehydrogenase